MENLVSSISWASVIVFFGACLVAIGSFKAAHDQSKLEKKLRNQYATIESANDIISEQNKQMQDQNSQIINKNEATILALDKVAKSVTGGDSYLSLSLVECDENLFCLKGVVESLESNVPGIYPLNNIHIEVKGENGKLLTSLNSVTAHLSVDTEYARLEYDPNYQGLFIDVTIFASNGQYRQIFYALNVDNHWEISSVRFNDMHKSLLRSKSTHIQGSLLDNWQTEVIGSATDSRPDTSNHREFGKVYGV